LPVAKKYINYFLLERIIKVSVSAAFYAVSEIYHSFKKIFGEKRNNRPIVLMYHAVNEKYLPEFKNQLERMREIGRITSLDQLDSSPGGEKTFAITFDDGLRSTVENGLPFLEKIGVPSTIFIPSGYLGKSPHWGTDPDNPYYYEDNERIIDEDFLRKLPTGIVDVGSHCVTHRRLTWLSIEEAQRELEDSKQSLEKIMRKSVRFLSFPFNDYDENILSLSRSSGYEKVFAATPVPDHHPESGFLFGRVDISPQDWHVESWLKLQGAYNWLPYAITLKRKIRSWIS
jgi:peptidoglycan/xylan/chitin deacetylase (PgdA/CDA1 family)